MGRDEAGVKIRSSYQQGLVLTGDGPPLVLVPGMDGTGRLFYRQVPLLARRYRVATYRLREDAPSMAVLVDDLSAVIGAASPGGAPAVVVGESFGGAVALSVALARRDLVAALVVLNSFPYFVPRRRLELAIFALRTFPFPWQAMGLVRRFTAFRLHSRHTHRAEIRRFLELTADTTRPGYLARLRVLREYDVRHRLHDINVPTLFLASDQDHLVPSVDQARQMAARVPGATLRVLAGHGHICLIAPDIDLGQILEQWGPPAANRGTP
jgi:pimeloyl-ACP methyl ester carboxylesterase